MAKREPAEEPHPQTDAESEEKEATPPPEEEGGKTEKAEEEREETPQEKYRRAGRIARQVLEEISAKIKVGARLVDLCEAAEARILELGGHLAFPTNVALNEVAAHYSSPEDDQAVVKEGDVVKLDVGVHIDGYIADTALTISLDPELESLVEASREALNRALEMVKPKVQTKELGRVIEETIRSYGYRPIRDLSGHRLEEYILHGDKSIPNISVPHGATLEEGEAYALETFATTGTGRVHETGQQFIFRLLPVRVPLRNRGARSIVRLVAREFRSLPFSRRYLAKHIPKLSLALGLRELLNKGVLHPYSVLADEKGSRVAQTEHTFIVTKDGLEITTQ